MAELGKMEKPEAGSFVGTRKLLLVPLVYEGEGSPAEYMELCNKYWEGVRASIESLEARIGEVKRVYHEVVSAAGEEGLQMIGRVSRKSHVLAQQRAGRGAVLEVFEDAQMLAEFSDWQRCASIGFMSNRVGNQIAGFYAEALKKRVEHLAKRIDETLGPEEVGLLFISEDHKVQFPAGVEVFYVAPPALDEIHRWLRDWRAKSQEGATGDRKE